MCAIDALGIPAMLGQDVVITSADPVTGEPVTVTAGPDRTTAWQPGRAVVFLGSRSCSARQPRSAATHSTSSPAQPRHAPGHASTRT